MIPVVTVIQDASKMMTPVSAPPINCCVWSIYSVIHYIHRSWCYFRFAKTYTTNNNLIALAGGHGLNFFTRDSILIGSSIRAAAYWVMVMQRLSLFVEQTAALSKASNHLSDAFFGNYVLSNRCVWEKNPDSKLCSPSTVNWINETWNKVSSRVYLVIMCIVALFQSMFMLSMRFMDVMELFSVSSELITEGVCQVGTNAAEGIDSLVKNQEKLLNLVKKGKPTLKYLTSSFKAVENIDDKFESLIVYSISAAKGIQKVQKVTGGVIEDVAKGILFGIASLFGQTRKIPVGLLLPPESSLPEVARERIFEWPSSGSKANC